MWVSLDYGDGTFQARQLAITDLGHDAGGWRVDKHLRLLADIAGDGCADIVGFFEDGVWVSLDYGDGTFRDPQRAIDNFAMGAGGWRIEKHPRFVSDVTGDGKGDIVGFGNAGVWTSINNGTGRF